MRTQNFHPSLPGCRQIFFLFLCYQKKKKKSVLEENLRHQTEDFCVTLMIGDEIGYESLSSILLGTVETQNETCNLQDFTV